MLTSLPSRLSSWISIPAGQTARIAISIAVTIGGNTNYYCGGQIALTGGCWTQLNGGYTHQTGADQVKIYLQGPAPGMDIYIRGFYMQPITRASWLADVNARTDQASSHGLFTD